MLLQWKTRKRRNILRRKMMRKKRPNPVIAQFTRSILWFNVVRSIRSSGSVVKIVNVPVLKSAVMMDLVPWKSAKIPSVSRLKKFICLYLYAHQFYSINKIIKLIETFINYRGEKERLSSTQIQLWGDSKMCAIQCCQLEMQSWCRLQGRQPEMLSRFLLQFDLSKWAQKNTKMNLKIFF